MKKKINKKKFNNVVFITILILVIVVLETIGFSAYQASLDIGSIAATIRIEKDIRINGVSVSGATHDAYSNYEEYTESSIISSVYLPYSDSTVSYDITITNLGNAEMGISEILGLPDNLTYSITGYNILDTLCDDTDSNKCKLGSVTTLHVTIRYAENKYDSNNTTYPFEMNVKFYSIYSTARIGNHYYDTLQEAVDDVTSSDETTIVLLRDAKEAITVESGQNIIFDFQNYTLSNKGNTNVIINKGNIKLMNGKISSSASSQGCINNESGGVITMTGGIIEVTGGRQAIYNNGGTVTISGTAYLSATTATRGTVQNNTSTSVLNILGGTIVSTGCYAIDNRGKMIIGTEGSGVSNTSPVIQGVTYGITSSTTYSLFDGVVKGKTAAFNNTARIVDWEDGYGFFNGTEVINGSTYKISYLAELVTVTFYPQEGTVSEPTRIVVKGGTIGTLPVPTRSEYIFEGWWTEPTGGEEILATDVINSSIDVYAHWIHQSEIVVARIGDTGYNSLSAAISAAPANTQTTIILERNTREAINVGSAKNIVLDLQNYTISNSGNNAVFENNGIITITNGTITSSADTSAINNNATGTLIITGGTISAIGSRQAIYNVGGIVEISGGYLISSTSGQPTNSSLARATIQNLTNGTLTITGGTIIGTKQQAISNEGSLTLGIDDGNIDSTSPIIMGETIAIDNVGTFGFYDGIAKGINNPPISGTITTQDSNAQKIEDTEVINGKTYNTVKFN